MRREADAGNLLRSRRQDESLEPDLAWVVEVQSLENLVHEFVHAVHQPSLAEDHGFDYARVPLRSSANEGW